MVEDRRICTYTYHHKKFNSKKIQGNILYLNKLVIYDELTKIQFF